VRTAACAGLSLAGWLPAWVGRILAAGLQFPITAGTPIVVRRRSGWNRSRRRQRGAIQGAVLRLPDREWIPTGADGEQRRLGHRAVRSCKIAGGGQYGDAGKLVGGQGEREVHAVDQRAGADPGGGLPVVAGGRNRAVERHAHVAQGVDERLHVVGIRVAGAGGGDDVFDWRFDLGAIGVCGPELGGVEEGLEDRGNVAAAGEVGLGHAIDEALRRIVADEADGELAGDELGSGRPSGEHVQKLAAFLLRRFP
jgi:hypothetical protein